MTAASPLPDLVKERPLLFSAPMVRALLEGRKTQTRRIVKPQPDSVKLLGPAGAPVPYRYAPPPKEMPSATYEKPIRCPYGVPGDVLWVKETWRMPDTFDGASPTEAKAMVDPARSPNVFFAADGAVRSAGAYTGEPGKTRVSIHMPRWASRLTLKITDIRVERLQDISEADAIAEGLYKSYPNDADREWFSTHIEGHTPTADEWAQFEDGVWMVPGVPQGWGMTSAERRRDTWAPTPEFAYRLLWEHINGPCSWDANPWVWAISFEVLPLSDDGKILLRAKIATGEGGGE